MSPILDKKPPIDAWLGEEIRFEGGQLHFEGSLRIDGRLDKVKLTGPCLVVGERAEVTGRVEVDRLEIYGRVGGEAVVAEEVLVAPGGSFHGDLRLRRPALRVLEGAEFRGRVTNLEPEASPAPSSDNAHRARRGASSSQP